jgi:hypothetical protein
MPKRSDKSLESRYLFRDLANLAEGRRPTLSIFAGIKARARIGPEAEGTLASAHGLRGTAGETLLLHLCGAAFITENRWQRPDDALKRIAPGSSGPSLRQTCELLLAEADRRNLTSLRILYEPMLTFCRESN